MKLWRSIGSFTVSATEIVSLRSLRSVATSLIIGRSSSGGKMEDDMVSFIFIFFLVARTWAGNKCWWE